MSYLEIYGIFVFVNVYWSDSSLVKYDRCFWLECILYESHETTSHILSFVGFFEILRACSEYI